MNARAVAAWSGACIVIALVTSNPAYKAAVVVAAFAVLAATAGLRRMSRLLVAVGIVTSFDALLNFASAHLGATVLFSVPEQVPALGGPYTLESLAFGVAGGITIAAAILAAAPFSLVLASHEVVDALPGALARSGTAVAASVNLAPAIGRSFVEVAEAQRLRGWRPRGPATWAEVVVPVVLTTAEGSIQLAESMEARGFGSGPRTAFARPRLATADWLVVLASTAALVLFLAARAAGWMADWFAYPVLSPPPLDPAGVVACALLFVPVVAWRRRG